MRHLLLIALFVTVAAAADPAADPQLAAKAQGLLAENCLKCHGPDKQKGGLRLDSAKDLMKGGEDGVVVVAGDPAKSMLIKAINWTDPDMKMPPKKKLSDEQIALLTNWVKAGAKWPAAAADPKKP